MPSPAWRRWPRRAGCGGDPLCVRPGSVERQHPLIRVGGDAHIAPGPDGQDRWDDTYKPPALAPDLPGGCGHPPLRGWEVFATQPGPAYTFMCPLHTRRLRAAPSPSRRGHELLVLGFRKIYGLSHSSWPGFWGGPGPPHPSGPMALPPSPWGKATSGGGCSTSTPLNSYVPPHCFNPRKRSASGGADDYISCRPSRARDRVTSSAYSSWLPTGTP